MLDTKYKMALTEVEEVLKNTDEELVKKIPNHIKKFITENKDLEYKVNIDTEIEIDNQKLMNETEAILSLIYRSYWCSEEEKEYFVREDNKILEEVERQKKEQYCVDNIFKNSITENYISVKQEESMTIIKKENIFTIILNKIKSFFAHEGREKLSVLSV